MRRWPHALIPFTEGSAPIFIHLAAAESGKIPFSCRGYGLRIMPEPNLVWIYILRSQWLRMSSYVEQNGELAVLLTSGNDNESYQIKGRYVQKRTMERVDVLTMERRRRMMALHASGLEPLHNVPASECLAVGIAARAVYVQTPGPNAGDALDEGGEQA